jgi:DNA primase
VIPDAEVEKVRDAADIVQIIGEHVNLRRMGADWRGPCPFHQGTHRNLSVSSRKRMFYCFVCHEGGDVFTFLQKKLGIDWPSAIRMVADKMGIELHEVDARREGPDPREPFWELNATVAEYFQRMLWDDDLGKPARDYLAQRRVSPELATRFGLGFAPREASLMRAHLASLGFDDARQLDGGLLVTREGRDEPQPRFRGRLMFPIYDVVSHLVGFGGRAIGLIEPKYLNSSDSEIFSKGRLLYGLNWAKHAIRRDERVMLVEGYFDVVRLVGAGVESVVAPLGTALTPDQAALITRYSKNVFLLYDSDKAGLKATFRAGDELLRHSASVRVVTLPEGEDPDTFVDKHGREGLEHQAQAAVDVFDRKIQLLERGGWFADLHKRRQAIDRLLPTIRATSDLVTRDIYLARTSEASGVDRAVLLREVEASAPRTAPASRSPAVVSVDRPQRRGEQGQDRREGERRGTIGSTAERDLIRSILRQHALLHVASSQVTTDTFRDPRHGEIFASLLRNGSDASVEDLAVGLRQPSIELLEALNADLDGLLDAERTLHDCMTKLRLRDLKEQMAAIQQQMSVAREDEKDQLMREKVALKTEAAELNKRLSTSRPVSQPVRADGQAARLAAPPTLGEDR